MSNEFIKKSPMKVCTGKTTGGHEMIVFGGAECPLCEKVFSHRSDKRVLKAVLYTRKLLISGEITLEEYIDATKDEVLGSEDVFTRSSYFFKLLKFRRRIKHLGLDSYC